MKKLRTAMRHIQKTVLGYLSPSSNITVLLIAYKSHATTKTIIVTSNSITKYKEE
ncbi:MAG: hypothetical protein L7V30_02445 [Gammaproteobacteria bacterium]|nr:hypothetical protein [Gammaproteobacteria bacterium]